VKAVRAFRGFFDFIEFGPDKLSLSGRRKRMADFSNELVFDPFVLSIS
jgi:hypothetical protein